MNRKIKINIEIIIPEKIKISSTNNNSILIDENNSGWNTENILDFLVNLVLEDENANELTKIELNEKHDESVDNKKIFKKYEHIYKLFEIFVDKFNEKID